MMNQAWIQEHVDSFIAENREALLRDMKTVIDIDSVEAPAEPNAPYGAGVRKALDAALAIARDLGLSTGECDGYMGYADVKGDSDTQLATITHLDVVPAGNGWDSDPFDMIEKEGWLIGRGVSDDKGPALLTLYMAKFFKEYCDQTGETLPYTLRVLLGCSEETGMTDVDYYLERNPMPAFCLPPMPNSRWAMAKRATSAVSLSARSSRAISWTLPAAWQAMWCLTVLRRWSRRTLPPCRRLKMSSSPLRATVSASPATASAAMPPSPRAQ